VVPRAHTFETTIFVLSQNYCIIDFYALDRILFEPWFWLLISSRQKCGLETFIIGKAIQVGLLLFRGFLPNMIDSCMRTTDGFCSNSWIRKFSSNFLPTGMLEY